MSLRPDEKPVPTPSADPFLLSGPVGHLAENSRADVIKAQMLLAEAGYLALPAPGIPTGWPGSGLVPGIRRLQRDSGLVPDGVLLPLGAGGRIGPNGEGETLAALQDAVGDRLAGRPAPTPGDIDRRHDAHATLSDAPDDSGPAFRPGAQVAQVAAPAAVILAPPPAGQAGSDGTSPPSPYPHESPVVRDAARALMKRFGYAGDNLRSLLDAARDLQQQDRQPLGAADKKATETPPLIPPKIDDRLPGRPAAAPELPDEKLIPPEIQDWYEGLEPFDQALAKELMLVLNSNGNETTRHGNDLVVQEIIDVLKSNHPRMHRWATHTHGATQDGNGVDHLKEEYLPNVDEHEIHHRTGSGRPDMVVQFARHIASRFRFNTSSQNADGTWTTAEDLQADKHEELSRELRPLMLEKLQKGESDDVYRGKIRPRIEGYFRQREAELTAQGEFEKPDPEVPAQYRPWWKKDLP